MDWYIFIYYLPYHKRYAKAYFPLVHYMFVVLRLECWFYTRRTRSKISPIDMQKYVENVEGDEFTPELYATNIFFSSGN